MVNWLTTIIAISSILLLFLCSIVIINDWRKGVRDARVEASGILELNEADYKAKMERRREYDSLHAHEGRMVKSVLLIVFIALTCATWILFVAGGFSPVITNALLTSALTQTGNAVKSIEPHHLMWGRIVVFVVIMGVSVFTPIIVCRAVQKHLSDND